MKLEDIAYRFFGNNLVIGSHIKKQLNYLKEILPAELRHRHMDDLGCGDGKVTVLLRDIFQPEKLRGFDVSPGLVRRARSRGIDAEVADLDASFPAGELAVVWGVLHHLRDFETCLKRLKENYPLVFIREPIKNGIFSGLELGHPMNREEILRMIDRHLPGSQVHFCDDNVLVFYTCPDYTGRKNT